MAKLYAALRVKGYEARRNTSFELILISSSAREARKLAYEKEITGFKRNWKYIKIVSLPVAGHLGISDDDIQQAILKLYGGNHD